MGTAGVVGDCAVPGEVQAVLMKNDGIFCGQIEVACQRQQKEDRRAIDREEYDEASVDPEGQGEDETSVEPASSLVYRHACAGDASTLPP